MKRIKNTKKLFLKTSKGEKIPTFTLEETIAKGWNISKKRTLSKLNSDGERYVPMTTEYNLSSEEGILIRACEQLCDKPYIVIHEKRGNSFYASIYLPTLSKRKRAF